MPHLAIDTGYFHHVCIVALYAATLLAAFVVLERSIYFGFLGWRTGSMASLIRNKHSRGADQRLARSDIVSRSLAEYIVAARQKDTPRARLEDLSAALYIKVNAVVSARLWLLDTVVTAAPLVGLLGTILGIMDTFNALSAGGISDPAAVSRGIGAALLATAIGIGTALFALLCYILLHRWADHITEEFKRILLLAEAFATRTDAEADAKSVGMPAMTNTASMAAE